MSIFESLGCVFTGDAGGGESETRRWLLQEQDLVEAIIQLPKNEFFNTGIHTYLWVLNRAKPASRKGFVLLINAESCFTKLKRNLAMKNCEIDAANRERIVQALRDYGDGPISRRMTIDQLLYNKVELELWRHDEQGRAINGAEQINGKQLTVRFDAAEFTVDDGVLNLATIFADHPDKTVKEAVALFNDAARQAEQTMVTVTGGLTYQRDNETGAIRVGAVDEGLGVLSVRAKVAKAKGLERAKVDLVLDRLLEKDSETVAYASDADTNNQLIAAFLTRWVHEPWCLHGAKTGCEINFNRVFPKVSDVRACAEILKDIAAIEAEMADLEADIAADIQWSAI